MPILGNEPLDYYHTSRREAANDTRLKATLGELLNAK